MCQELVTHACNPSYQAGRDQEDRSQFEATPGKQFLRHYLEKPETHTHTHTHTQKGLVE
jgi:hypothetical protein